MTYSWVQTGKLNQKSQKQLQKAMKSENANSNAANNALDFLKVLYQVFFFPGCYAILKGFSYLLGVKFTGLSNILPVTSWQLTNRTVSDISCRSRHSICQSFFFPHEIIMWFKSIQAKQVDLETWSPRLVTSRPHALKLASLTFKDLSEVDL